VDSLVKVSTLLMDLLVFVLGMPLETVPDLEQVSLNSYMSINALCQHSKVHSNITNKFHVAVHLFST